MEKGRPSDPRVRDRSPLGIRKMRPDAEVRNSRYYEQHIEGQTQSQQPSLRTSFHDKGHFHCDEYASREPDTSYRNWRVRDMNREPTSGRYSSSLPPGHREMRRRNHPESCNSHFGPSQLQRSAGNSGGLTLPPFTGTDITDSSSPFGNSHSQQAGRLLPFEHYTDEEKVSDGQDDQDPFTSDAIQFRSFKQTTKMFEKSLDEFEHQDEEEEGGEDSDDVLPKQRMELFCEVCKVGVSSVQALQDHFAGSRHQKELRKSGLSSDLLEIGRDKYTERDPSLKTKILSCKLCDVSFGGADMSIHVNDPAHLSALRDYEDPPPKDDPFWFVEVGQLDLPEEKEKQPAKKAEGYHCELCSCTIPHYELFQIHLKGKSHQKKLKWIEGQKEIPSGMQQHWCSVCNIFCTNREALANHLVGKKHAKTLRQKGVTKTGQQDHGSANLPAHFPPCTQASVPQQNPLSATSQRLSVPYASINTSNRRVRCSLCHFMLYSNDEVRRHMASEEHVRNVMANPHLKLQDFLILDS